jgi:AcrR family transcriptional regulator
MSKDDKRQEIMKAAERLFATRRFHEVTTDDVARAAEVGKGTIYRYFRDKDDLFFQTATSGFDEMCDLVRRRVEATAPFGEQLLAVCRHITGFFESRQELLRMMQTEDGRMVMAKGTIHDRWMVHRRKLVAAVAEILGRGVAEGRIRSDLPAEVLAEFLLGLLRTRTRDLRDAPAAVRRHEVVVDLFCRGAETNERGTRNAERGTQARKELRSRSAECK